MSLPSNRAIEVGKAFRDGRVCVYDDLSCNATEVRYGFIMSRYTVMRIDADGMMWITFPLVAATARRITVRTVLNGLLSGLGIWSNYRFELKGRSEKLVFLYRMDPDGGWIHRVTDWDEWLPIAEGRLAQLAALNLMPARPALRKIARAFTTTVDHSAPQAASASENQDGSSTE
jgi:hypothetical protein